MYAFSTEILLLRLIHRRVRQRDLGSSMVMIAGMCASQKNQAPVSRGPILYGARRTSGRAAIVVHIVTAVAVVKQS
jgi:hypothetical protein